MDASRAEARVAEVLRSVFGFEHLRPMQDEAIRASLAGRDALVVLPTGGGKSLCYQLPALVRPGLTLVVSPLIALMQDQVAGLAELGVGAGMLNSAQDAEGKRATWRRMESGELRLLYVSPERLLVEGFLDELRRYGLNGAAIDEAHCISHWGHDFRPEYRQLGELKERHPWLALQAFTATATPSVRADIVRQLGLVDPLVLVGNFDRPNLTYRALPRRDAVDQIHAVIRRHPGDAGIVYCLRRADVDDTAAALKARGVKCVPYHAGMSSSERTRAQDDFLNERVDVVVATVAFGMGIDRPDVRFVVHQSLPKGIEQYSQETGRAGRDGLASECVLFFGGADFHGWKQLMEKSAREAEAGGAATAMEELEHALERLGHLWNFATGAACRHKQLVEYFGQAWELRADAAGCGACDVCLGEIATLPDSQVVAQKILSCVVRCGQRFGATHVTDVLRGAQNQRILQYGHQDLSTYGLLKDKSTKEVRAWIDQLVGQGHLRVADGEYPILFLSKSGIEVMKAARPVTLYVPVIAEKKSAKRPTRHAIAAEDASEAALDVDERLFEHLRAFRRELAAERGVPPYLVFNDKTLALFAAKKPATPEEFRAIKGVGDKKAADLGPLFLRTIAEFAG
ncbi:MAG: DNA helicase RecQ [Planctomycetes bacterium]|nr:DNA helicase RecQ [Planctomycetota bacterium]